MSKFLKKTIILIKQTNAQTDHEPADNHANVNIEWKETQE